MYLICANINSSNSQQLNVAELELMKSSWQIRILIVYTAAHLLILVRQVLYQRHFPIVVRINFFHCLLAADGGKGLVIFFQKFSSPKSIKFVPSIS